MPIYGANGQITSYAPRYQRTTTLSPDQQKLLGLETQSKYNMGTAGVEQSAALREHLKNNQIDPSQWAAWQDQLKGGTLRKDEGVTDRANIEKADDGELQPQRQTAGRPTGSQPRGAGPVAGYGGVRPVPDAARRQSGEAARKAYLTSGDEARRAQAAYNDATTGQYNMDQALASYYNNLRGAQGQEAYARRNQPINEITALMSGSQATIPQFQPFRARRCKPSNIGQYITTTTRPRARRRRRPTRASSA